MSTMTMPAARQPFASLSDSRLKNLTNVKNKQNALPTTTASSLKRHAPNEFDDVDSENIDPLLFSSPSKKARGFDFDTTKPVKTPLFALSPATKPSQYIERAQAAGQKRKVDESTATPNHENLSMKRVHPSSAPAPAGRSPKSKKAGILSRRRKTASPFTRINPPTFSTGQASTELPFSIDAALAGSVPAYKSKSKSKSTYGKSWQFEIHEDSPQEELTNLMQHPAYNLDISDDERRTAAKGDRDNKENIPPSDGSAAIGSSTQSTASRRDMMTDESRSPLGDLEAKEFYAEGCDASSFFLLEADESTDDVYAQCASVSNLENPCSLTRTRADAMTSGHDGWKDIPGTLAPQATSSSDAEQPLPPHDNIKGDAADIQIWESESAKGDDDNYAQEPLTAGTPDKTTLA